MTRSLTIKSWGSDIVVRSIVVRSIVVRSTVVRSICIMISLVMHDWCRLIR